MSHCNRSLIETGAHRLRPFWVWLASVLGSILGLGALTVAAWLWCPVTGWATLGVSFLLIDFKAAADRKARAEK